MTDSGTDTNTAPNAVMVSGAADELAQPLAKAQALSGGEMADRRLERRAAALARGQIAIPKDLQGRPADIFALMIRAEGLGIDALAMVQGCAVINGRVSLGSDIYMAVALGLGCKVSERLETGEDPDDMSEWVAVCEVERNGHVTTAEFSAKDAATAGLWGKAGPWKTHPKRMLQHRARTFAIRDACADRLAGLPDAQEMRDVTPASEA